MGDETLDVPEHAIDRWIARIDPTATREGAAAAVRAAFRGARRAHAQGGDRALYESADGAFRFAVREVPGRRRAILSVVPIQHDKALDRAWESFEAQVERESREDREATVARVSAEPTPPAPRPRRAPTPPVGVAPPPVPIAPFVEPRDASDARARRDAASAAMARAQAASAASRRRSPESLAAAAEMAALGIELRRLRGWLVERGALENHARMDHEPRVAWAPLLEGAPRCPDDLAERMRAAVPAAWAAGREGDGRG